MLVSVVTPFNGSIFPEYILPNVRHLLQDRDVPVRSMLAQCIVPLAETAVTYLEMGRAHKASGSKSKPTKAEHEIHVGYPREARINGFASSRTSY